MCVLVINAGRASVKFTVFENGEDKFSKTLEGSGVIENPA